MNQTEAATEKLADHHAYLRARLRGLGVAEASLDDAVQDVYEVLVRRIGDYDSRFSLRQWMAGVARKVARRHRERDRRAPMTVDEGRLPASTIDPERSAARQQGLAVLRRFLAGLDEDRWAVFVLSEIEGLRGTEIAAELEVNLSTVYARLRAAKRQFEAAAVELRGPGRPWFGGLLLGPTSLFRRAGTAAFTTPLVLCALATAGLGVTLGSRSCGDGQAEPASVEVVNRQARAPTGEIGIAGRAVDPARVVHGPPVADAEGWFGGSSGRAEDDRGLSLRHQSSYRLEGADLVLRCVYSNEGTVASGGFGWLDLDGFELVEGSTEWDTALAVGEVRELRWRLRARRPGVVAAPMHDGPVLRGVYGSRGEVRLVFAGGVLRRCEERECEVRSPTVAEAATGELVKLQLHNACDREIEVVEVPLDVDVPPPDARRFQLAVDERRAVEVDVAFGFARVREDGRTGSSAATDTPGATIRFSGVKCESVGTDP